MADIRTNIQPRQQTHGQNSHTVHQPLHINTLGIRIVITHIPVIPPHPHDYKQDYQCTNYRRINDTRHINLE